MSLDIWLSPPQICPHCGSSLRLGTARECFEANFTHNVVPMWQKAGVYEALYLAHGRYAREFITSLELGIQRMEENFAEYESLDSPNGWGLAKNALPWLRKVAAAFRANPDAVIGVSK